jgi:hypothetical protein
MGLTTDGLNYMGYVLVNGAYIDLLDANGNTPSASLNYASVPCYWAAFPSGATDPQKERMAVFNALDGTLFNMYDFCTNEADDPTYDYANPPASPSPVWGTLTQLRIRHGSTEYYRAPLMDSNGDPVSVVVYQDYQVRFKSGAISITFTATEVSP